MSTSSIRSRTLRLIDPKPEAQTQSSQIGPLRIVRDDEASPQVVERATGSIDSVPVLLPALQGAEAGEQGTEPLPERGTANARQPRVADRRADTRRVATAQPRWVAPKPRIQSVDAHAASQPSYLTRHCWRGVVVDTKGDGFRARLEEMRPGLPPEDAGEEYGDFSLEGVTDDDLDLVEVGAVFYWSVGYKVEARGQRVTWGDIRFRRLPVWTARDLAKLDEPSDLDQFFGSS